MKFKMGYMTGSETAYLALYEDKDNYTGAFVDSWPYHEALRGARMRFYGLKLSKGKKRVSNGQFGEERGVWHSPPILHPTRTCSD